MMQNSNRDKSRVAFVNKFLFIKIPDNVSHLQNKAERDFIKARLLLLAACVLGALGFVITLRTSPAFVVGVLCTFGVIAVLMQLGIYAFKGIAVLFVGANGLMAIVELATAQSRVPPLMTILASAVCLLILLFYKNSTNFFIFKALKRSNVADASKIKQELHNHAHKPFR